VPINCYEFQVCRAGEPCNCKQTGTRQATYGADWLKRCSRNPMVLQGLRSLANTSGINISDSESIIRFVASQLTAGTLRVCQKQGANWGGGSGDPGSGGSPAEDTGKPFPFTGASSKPSSASSRSTESDPPTLSDSLDGAAQAAVLNSAAKDGAPFCPE